MKKWLMKCKYLPRQLRTWWKIRQAGGQPQDLAQTFNFLERLLPKEQIELFRSTDEKKATVMAHFAIGMWLRNNLNLWNDGPLVAWFKDRGIVHADDMSGIILTCFHRHLKSESLGLQDEIEYYRDYWKSKGLDPDTLKELK